MTLAGKLIWSNNSFATEIRHTMKLFYFPKEHGIWGMLLFPYISVTILLDSISLASFLFLLSVIFIILGRYPLSLIIRREEKSLYEKRSYLISALFYLTMSLLLFIYTAVDYNFELMALFALLGIIILSLNLFQIYKKSHRNIMNEVIAIIFITTPIFAYFYILNAFITKESWIIYFVYNFYFIGVIFHVKSKLSQSKKYSILSFVYNLTLFTISGIAGLYYYNTFLLFLVFLIVVLKSLLSLFRGNKKMTIKSVGMYEIVHGLIFAIVLGLIFKYIQ